MVEGNWLVKNRHRVTRMLGVGREMTKMPTNC
jgi:hypothetical protein